MDDDSFRSTTPPAPKMMKSAYFSLLAGPVIQLSSEPGSRSLDTNGECFVVACKVKNDLFMPYGLKLVIYYLKFLFIINVISVTQTFSDFFLFP